MTGRSSKATTVQPFQEFKLENDHCTQISHFETEFSSVIAFTSMKGYLTGLDLRSNKTIWSYKSPSHFGNLSAMAIDKNRNWIQLGTHRGVLTLFDIRFHVNTTSWRHPSKGRINQLDRYSLLPQGNSNANISKCVIMSVQNKSNELSVWDVDSKQCYQVWTSLKNEIGSVQEEFDSIYGDGFTVRDY